MNAKATAISGLVVGLLVLSVAWLFELPVGRVAVLAPLVVLVAAAIAGLGVFWARAAAESLGAAKHPRLILAVLVAVVVLGVVLTFLGIELPRE